MATTFQLVVPDDGPPEVTVTITKADGVPHSTRLTSLHSDDEIALRAFLDFVQKLDLVLTIRNMGR